jgi:hypothetical protein
VCGGSFVEVLEIPDAPVFCNVFPDTADDAAAAPRGPIELGFCTTCGLARNTAFDPELVRYSPAYENSLHFSPTFRGFADDLARRLIERYDLRGKDVVDIGCGKGDFLELLCHGTGNRGVGYDPSYEGPLERRNGSHLTFVREYFSSRDAEGPADLISCRHVLEHLEAPGDLLRTLEPSDAVLYFEMPDAEYMFREAAIWDVIYEHVSYFSGPALRRLFAEHGFHAHELSNAFGGQYLYIEAAKAATPSARADEVERLGALASSFGEAYRAKVATWNGRLAELRRGGRRVALWGAGSKGVMFLNTVEGAGEIEIVIDATVRKHGRHVPGGAQRVQGPDRLGELRPDVVLVMNPLYAGEIGRRLADAGCEAELVVV